MLGLLGQQCFKSVYSSKLRVQSLGEKPTAFQNNEIEIICRNISSNRLLVIDDING